MEEERRKREEQTAWDRELQQQNWQERETGQESKRARGGGVCMRPTTATVDGPAAEQPLSDPPLLHLPQPLARGAVAATVRAGL